jgi:GntR family transcriptional repressor for pyruvate dehydrogenase complex
MSFKPITPPPRFRLSDAVYTQLEKMVVDGALQPGEALPSERDLAQQLSVSRPSLREALLRLESRHLIVGRTGGGYQVGNASTPLFADPLTYLMAGHAQTARDIVEMREVLESMAVELAALRATPDDLRNLEAAAARLEAAFGDGAGSAPLDELVELDARFHLALAEATHNVVLAHTMHAIHGLVRDSVRRSYQALGEQHAAGATARGAGRAGAAEALAPADTGDAPGADVADLVRQHRAILDAVSSGDPERARQAVRAHLALIRRGALAAR